MSVQSLKLLGVVQSTGAELFDSICTDVLPFNTMPKAIPRGLISALHYYAMPTDLRG
jgi:hypothetical protein